MSDIVLTGLEMQCPACTGPLMTKYWQGMEWKICQYGCFGIWMPHQDKNLRKLMLKVDLEEIRRLFSGPSYHYSVQDKLRQDVRMCPRDGKRMSRYEWNPGSNVVFDNCPACNGFWLQAGELFAYAEFIQTNNSSKSGPLLQRIFNILLHPARLINSVYKLLKPNAEEQVKNSYWTRQ